MATQPYPSQYGVAPSSSRNVYRINTAAPGMPGPHSAGAYYPPPQHHPHPHAMQHPHHHQQMYLGQPDMSAFGLVTPPTTTSAQFGSPLIAGGGYPGMAGTPTPQWSMNVNALALSPAIGNDGTMPSFYAPSPLLGGDPSGDVFSTGPMSARDDMTEGLGFHGGPQMGHHHHAHHMYGVVPGQLGAKPGHHLMLDAAGNPAPEIKKRSRTAQACERCRIRKARPANSGMGTNTGSTSTTPTLGSTSTTTVSKPGPAPGKPSRRHSLPEQPGAAPSFATGPPPGPQKGYSSTDVHQVGTGESTPVAYSVPSSTVIPHLPTPVGAEYLAVPGQSGQPSAASGTGSRPPSDPTYYHNTTELRSPVFAFTPDSAEPATSVSAEYPYTPISPATTFSPQLGMTPAVPGQYAPRQPPAQDQTLNDSNVWYSATSTN
ncbi:hypothetical protein CC85DRAFT_319663 [Cutaneotrichosporon oleaginosum]|uniref:Uncharacterized protein n=1 Tax=Cutaneotrichosporon oleaginosum TaxID=879819 RepID=A0A0J0XKT6_9TREE|nr:uncharacterized protein CC85DRAFT_319663 [Cutaneotrichosporon oleaginosum]KLT41711.1 hypothetical protein CC85DRAFT_319663 [Cutaneotrichosporon oleaginosum]TXT08083.1 hypothetical protein COLE_05007 [Cutaneotrichosporon oleaginosum]